MVDGIPSALGDIGSESIVAGGIDNSDLADNSASGTKVSGEFALAYAGSPSVASQTIQAAEFVTGAGSSVSVDFGTEFGAAPIVVPSLQADSTGWVRVAGASAGSAVIETESASQSGTLFAIGSGRV